MRRRVPRPRPVLLDAQRDAHAPPPLRCICLDYKPYVITEVSGSTTVWGQKPDTGMPTRAPCSRCLAPLFGDWAYLIPFLIAFVVPLSSPPFVLQPTLTLS